MSDNTHQDQNHQQISDDQELAKVLQGMQQQTQTMGAPGAADTNKAKSSGPGVDFEATPPANKPASSPAPSTPASPGAPSPQPASAPSSGSSAAKMTDAGLESLKKEALEELRPLADKLELPPKEKFDTMLLIIRSTDDRNLLQPAHEAAKAIEDDVVRAEALLDIVKEVDYFASKK